MKHPAHLAAALLVVTLACASAPTAFASVQRPTGPRDVVTHSELVASGRANLLDYVRLHRPSWLRTRAVTGEVVVYLDGIRMGGPEALQEIRPEMVAEVRHLDAREATTRWGTGHTEGAILVVTGRTSRSEASADA
ncbi:MAG TPA: hypothetical protein VF167_18115 [Longimicrobiaceae bacterium]